MNKFKFKGYKTKQLRRNSASSFFKCFFFVILQSNQWKIVSNNIGLTSRRFTINHLVPDTFYSFKIRANNPSGSIETQFEVFTATNMTLKSELDTNTDQDQLTTASSGRIPGSF